MVGVATDLCVVCCTRCECKFKKVHHKSVSQSELPKMKKNMKKADWERSFRACMCSSLLN